MKKYLLICALAIAGMAFAKNLSPLPQGQVQKVNMIETANKVATVEATPFNWLGMNTFLSERRAHLDKVTQEYAWADYYYTPGAFHNGFFAGFMGFGFAAICLPYLDSVVYTNVYGPTDWYEEDENGQEVVVAEDTTYFTTSYGFIPDKHIASVPKTGDHDLVITVDDKDTTLHIKGTTYGNTASSAYLFSATVEHPSMLGGDNIPLTMCAMHCDTLDDTHDYWRIGGGATGDTYFNGTGIHLNAGDEHTADTLGVLVENLGVMKFDEIIVAIYSETDQLEKVIPSDAEIRVALFPLDEKGIHFDDTIASTTITQADFQSEAQSWGILGTLSAKFKDIDVLGQETQTPVWVDGSFYLQFTNFNESGCNFGIFADYNCPVTATTIYQHDGEFSYRGSSKAGGREYGQNLLISFDGYFPGIVNDTIVNNLNAPLEGGYAYFGEDTEDQAALLWTNVDPSVWEIEAEDWLSVEYDDEYFASHDAVFVAFNCEALPEGQLGRECTVVINADGAKIEFTIKQGTIYTVAGGLSDEGDIDDPVFGKSWNTDLVENNLEQDGEILVWEKENLELTAGQKIMFKVVKDHAWDEAWPAENYEVSVEEDGQYKLTITFNPEDKSVNATLVNTTPVVYTVAGGLSDEGNIDDPVFGKSWNPELSDNDMVLEEDLYVWKKENLELTAGQKIQFKVVKNHSWNKAWPESNYEVSIAKDGIYALTITFKEDEEKVDAILVKVPDYPDLADGYYLVGTFNDWTPTAEDLLVLNEGAEGEYTIIVDLNEGDEFKAVRIENGDIAQWYPEGMGNNYVVDADHAGHKTVYFRPAGSEEWGGDFWIDMYEGFEQISADGKPVKVIYNGEMLIIRGDKIFNAQGATVK